MRNAALTLGVIGGVLAMIVGFFGFGYTAFVSWFGEVPDVAEQVENAEFLRFASVVAPILGIAGGAMARSRARTGGALMLLSAGGIYAAYGYGVFTMFPIALCALGGVLALVATQPDEA